MIFKDKVVLVTGSSRGIGKEIALSFAREGATVIINGCRDRNVFETTLSEIKLINQNCTGILSDISNYEETCKMFEKIYKNFTHIDILVNNAGSSHIGLLSDMTIEEWNKVINTNLNSIFHTSKMVIPKMVNLKQGCIINISSIWGEIGASCEVAYSSSKGGVNSFTKALSKELGPSNIRVNAISCGMIDTEMNACFSEEEKQAFIEDTSLMKIGTPQDVANLCLFIASEKAKFLTGQIITLDGGS